MELEAEHETRAEDRPSLIVFDLGEVLSSAPKLYAELAALTDRDEGVVKSAYWARRDEYDRGGSAESYWGRILRELDINVDAELVEALSHTDSSSWTSLRPRAVELLRDVALNGNAIAILSNAPAALATYARATAWAPYVSTWFFSGELGLAKPDRQIYEQVVAATGTPAGSILFLDDRSANVVAACAAGWRAHLWTSDADARALLFEVGALDSLGEEER